MVYNTKLSWNTKSIQHIKNDLIPNWVQKKKKKLYSQYKDEHKAY